MTRPDLTCTLLMLPGEDLLVPTTIYTVSVLPLMKEGLVKAFAHITGGGLTDNLPRVLPAGLAVHLDARKWTVPPIFGWLAEMVGFSKRLVVNKRLLPVIDLSVMCVYEKKSTHTHTHICTHTHTIHTQIHTHTWTHTCTYTHAHIQYIHKYTLTHGHTHTYNTYTNTHTYAHPYTQTHNIHTQTHRHTQRYSKQKKNI